METMVTMVTMVTMETMVTMATMVTMEPHLFVVVDVPVVEPVLQMTCVLCVKLHLALKV